MSLEQYKNRQSEQINQFSNTIADLQRQLNDLNQQLRIAKQVHQAAVTGFAQCSAINCIPAKSYACA